ncbi:MAG: D-sedoheptulose 7-phosphate isomerase [Candidatus Aenigmarchaeota archaeon]|nr:D-sedoheptulose 7-phosphate isomerase [Candidatus Aenigmarchaeota archaeon]MDI6722351.1 D-sedoheptulose 7-phosphate isomerase [Candidatus Aenigmarchaeota archaeon]
MDVETEIEDHMRLISELGGLSEKISLAAEWAANAISNGKKLVIFGNGGSAADAQHIAAEFVGRFLCERRALPAIALTTDTSILTSIGNDYGFSKVFERQVEALANEGDLAIGISTSGNSENVLLGLGAAKRKGADTIGLLGNDGGKIARSVDLPIIVPSNKTPRIQEAHILIGHIICAISEQKLK